MKIAKCVGLGVGVLGNIAKGAKIFRYALAFFETSHQAPSPDSTTSSNAFGGPDVATISAWQGE
jgi:hypothetical protein